MLRRDLLRAVCGLGMLSPHVKGEGRDARGLRAGAAKVDITPGWPVALEGYLEPETRMSVGVHDHVYARAVAFSGGQKRLVVVSCDLCTFTLADYLARPILEAFGLRPDELMLCATHTHSGPLVTLNTRFPANVRYTESLPQQLTTVVGRALANVGPARLSLGRGRSAVGVNRRKPVPGGGMQMAPNPDGVRDPEVLALIVSRPGRRPFAALFTCACHSRSLGAANRLLSGDILGIAEKEVEAGAGLELAAALAGASADIDPAAVVDGFGPTAGTPETMRLGTSLGREVLNAIGGATPLATQRGVTTASARVGLPDRWGGRPRPLKLCGAAIGDLALVGLDCEASVEIGLAVKAGSPFPATLVITNCNGGAGYLPVAHQYAEGGYEVEHTAFAEGAAGQLVRETLDMLSSMRTFTPS